MSVKAFFLSSQKQTRKLAARTFIQPLYLKALAASFQVSFLLAIKTAVKVTLELNDSELG